MSTIDVLTAPLDIATTFLTALFDHRDLILFRPVETWCENGKKRSRVDYNNTIHTAATPDSLRIRLSRLLEHSAAAKTNLFFGVCPRFGRQGRYDLAWQIRTVRALWTDIDNITVDEAFVRLPTAGLPEPSIVIGSGNGIHVYWLLDQSFLIDDAGDPPAVLTEWIEHPNGRKKPRKFIVDDSGERTYLDTHRHLSQLSPKAQNVQNVLAGIASACGGDHTTDLARLLRIPGSLNRKDERNGKRPIPTELVRCEPDIRYPFSVFESLAVTAPEVERQAKIALMPLPRTRKLSTAKSDSLATLIATSALTPAGARSEADFAICCFAVRNGIDKQEVWSQVEHTGKFAEGGQRYFDRTWANAELAARTETFERLQSRVNDLNRPASQPVCHGDDPDNGRLEQSESGGSSHPTIRVQPSSTPVAVTLRSVTDRLLSAGDCFTRAEQLVVVDGEAITVVLSAAELAGLLNQHVEFYFVDEDGAGEFKPLTPAYANTWLNNRLEKRRLAEIKLFTRNPVFTEDWRLVAPGHDADSGIYYAGPAVESRGDTSILDALLREFCFKSPADRTNYIGILLTAILMPRFIGAKPAVLFNGNQPGLGKSILAQILAIVRDGHPVETASYNPNDEEFEKRLGSIVRRGATTIVVDNAKGRGRDARIDSPCLERSITDPILSFRLLGQSQDIRAENSHIFCLTANSPDVSRDLVSRSVVINLFYEGNPERRTFTIPDPEGYAQQHRLEILGELIGLVERWKAAGSRTVSVNSRFNKRGWGNIVGGVLEANGEPDFLANAEEASTMLDDMRREFAELVAILVDHPQGIWTAAELTEQCDKHGLLKAQLGEGSARSKATRLGVVAGRYVAERFTLADGRVATFHRDDRRNGKVYKVGIDT